MSWTSLVLHFVSSIIWPIAVIIALVLFREALNNFINSATSVKTKWFEVTRLLDQQVATLRRRTETASLSETLGEKATVTATFAASQAANFDAFLAQIASLPPAERIGRIWANVAMALHFRAQAALRRQVLSQEVFLDAVLNHPELELPDDLRNNLRAFDDFNEATKQAPDAVSDQAVASYAATARFLLTEIDRTTGDRRDLTDERDMKRRQEELDGVISERCAVAQNVLQAYFIVSDHLARAMLELAGRHGFSGYESQLFSSRTLATEVGLSSDLVDSIEELYGRRVEGMRNPDALSQDSLEQYIADVRDAYAKVASALS